MINGNKNKKTAFTILELLVSIAIMSAIVSVVLWNQNKFNNDLDVANLAYRVALAVREAQIYGVSVKSDGSGATDEFEKSYGVHFYFGQNNNPDDPNRKSLIVYADKNGDLMYENGDNGNDQYVTTSCPTTANSECVERLVMNRGNKIKKICMVRPTNDAIDCYSGAGTGGIRSIDVLFKRPNPDAIFSSYNMGGNQTPEILNSLLICVVSPDLKEKQIAVYATGQISVGEGCTSGTDIVEPPIGEEVGTGGLEGGGNLDGGGTGEKGDGGGIADPTAGGESANLLGNP